MQEIFKINRKLFIESAIKFQFANILDGEYSLTKKDSILIEEKLAPGEGFKAFCTYGLADIRIIVFNLVPVAAMIRIPTEESEGKANINAWGIGCGIDIQTGNIYSTLYEGKIYKKLFPKVSKMYQGMKIPFWDDLLFLSSKIQYFVNLWYLALDRVITEDGPKLLEINARAGLEVQNISDTRLQKILNKIEDLQIQDPQKGVEIGKTLLAREYSNSPEMHKILYLSQDGILKIKDATQTEEIPVVVSIDLNKKKNYISPELYTRVLQTTSSLHIALPENSIILRQLEFLPSDKVQNWIVLGKQASENFLIRPYKLEQKTINILKSEVVVESELAALHQLDDKVDLSHRRLNLTTKLRPINYFDELDNFISWKGNYAPIFSYDFPSEKKMIKRKEDLLSLKEETSGSKLKSPLVQLFDEKVDELFMRHQLLDAYKKQDYQNIEEGNILLRGEFDEKLVKLSKEKIAMEEKKELLGGSIWFTGIKDKIEKRLNELEIYNVDIVESSSTLSRISVSMGKDIKINVAQGAEFWEKEIDAIIAHEIDTHLLRYINGKKSWWHIFSSGTGFYLEEEEGLAIWNAKQKLPEGYESLGIYKKYYLLYESMHLNFKQLFDLVSIVYPQYSLEGRFKACIRIKKGIIHNSNKQIGRSWMKNKVYLEGYMWMREERIEKWMDVGKIKFRDLGFIVGE